jgi:hypothetical protein
VFRIPVRGDARIAQATPATSGGTKSGNMLAAAIRPFQGVFVRTTTHEKVSPISTASAVPPVQTTSELISARWTLGLARTAVKFPTERLNELNPSMTGLASVRAPSSKTPSG